MEITEDEIIKTILRVESSESMLDLLNTEPKEPPKKCCANVLNSLKVDDNVTVCSETLKS